MQAFDATEALVGGGGGTDPDPGASPTGLTAYNNGKTRGTTSIGLAWTSGAVTVDVYRNNTRIVSAITNNGSYNDSVKGGNGTLTYKVCNAGTTECSANATVNY